MISEQELSTQRFAASIVAGLVNASLERGTHGILLSSLPKLDDAVLFERLGEAYRRESFYLCLLDSSRSDGRLAHRSGFSDDDLILTPERAVDLRSTGTKALVVFAHRETRKMTGLREFTRIRGAALHDPACDAAEERARNVPQREFWKAIRDMAEPVQMIPIQGLLDCAAIVSAEGQVDGQYPGFLPLMGLFKDERVLTGRTTSEIRQRLEANYDLVRVVEQLSPKEQSAIRSALGHAVSDDKTATVKNLIRYRQKRDRSALALLEFEEVEEVLVQARRSRRTRQVGARRVNAEPVEAIVPLLAEGRFDELEELGRRIQQVLYEEDEDADEAVENPLTGERYQRVATFEKTWPYIEMVSTDVAWGGVLRTEANSIVEALNNASVESFSPLTLDGHERLLELISQQVAMGVLDASVETDLLAAQAARRELVPHIRKLIEQPTLFLAADPEIRKYAGQLIEALRRVLAGIRNNYEAMVGRGIQSAESVVGQLLSLDQLLIVHPDERSSVLTLPLNAVELWKHLTLADQMRAQVAALDDEERRILQGELHQLPALVDVITVPNLATGKGVHTLVYSRKLGHLPSYEEVTRRFREVDGTDELLPIVERLVNVYPHAQEGLRIALVEPPSAMAAIATLRASLGRGRAGVRKLFLTIFRSPSERVDPGALIGEDEEEALGDEIFSGSQRRLFVEFVDLKQALAYDEVAERLSKSPQHLTVVFDPSLLADQRYPRTEGPDVHPLSVPMTFEYDEGMDRLALVPEPSGPLFSDRTELESKLGHHLRNTFPALVADYPAQMEALDGIGQHSLWLAIADFAKDTSPGLKIPPIGVRRAGRRDLTLFTHHLDKFETAFADQLHQSNFDPQPERLSTALRELTRFLDEGMLAVLARRGGTLALQPRLIGAIGVLVVVDGLRQAHPDALIVSIDSPVARRWLRVERSDKRADLLALIDHGDAIEIRIVEVKTHDAPKEDVALRDGVVSGEAIDQLAKTAEVCEAVVGIAPSDILTAARREVLRTQIFNALKTESRSKRQHWWRRLNELLAGHIQGRVTTTLASVQLGEPAAGSKTEARTADGRSVTVQILAEGDVRAYFDRRIPAALPVPSRPPRPDSPQEDDGEADGGAPGRSPMRTDDGDGPGESGGAAPVPDEIIAQAADLKRVISGYDIPVISVDPELAEIGPTVIRYKIRLRSNAKIKDLQRRAEDIQRELAAVRVPLIDNVPGEPLAYVDLRRPDPQIVYLSAALDRMPTAQKPDLWVPAGMTPSGRQRDLDLMEAPHLLVSGTTKSGKTMFLYSVIIALARRNSPEHLQLLLVDPKATDFVYFEGLPHLAHANVVTDAGAAVAAIQHMTEPEGEMEVRTMRLRQARCRDIQDYNRQHPDKPMKPLVIVIDEYADLIMVLGRHKSDFEAGVNRLAQRGRSVGIHLVVATQRPSVEFVTGALKANMPTRISFRLPSQTDSRVILDRNGAESLLGNGDMLLFDNGEVERLQGFFVGSEEIDGLLA